MAQAVGGSSAVPAGFPPKYIFDGYNQSEYLIDGGVIGNNPSLIAFSLKKYGNDTTKSKNLRIMSLGAGSSKESELIKDSNQYNQLSNFVQAIGSLSSTTPSALAEFYLNDYFKRQSKESDFLRCQVETTASMMTTSKEGIQTMRNDGAIMWNNYKEQIKEMVRTIMDQKFGS